jgi:hypothetical protein
MHYQTAEATGLQGHEYIYNYSVKNLRIKPVANHFTTFTLSHWIETQLLEMGKDAVQSLHTKSC